MATPATGAAFLRRRFDLMNPPSTNTTHDLTEIVGQEFTNDDSEEPELVNEYLMSIEEDDDENTEMGNEYDWD